MVIGGLQKFSLLDFPGHLAAIIFTQGCNYCCHFCYNPMLVGPAQPFDPTTYIVSPGAPGEDVEKVPPRVIPEADLFDFLASRQGKLDAVVVSGGEPTIHSDLPALVAKIRALKFLVKLDTNGSNPAMIESLIKSKQLDYIAMDLKGPLSKYGEITAAQPDLDAIRQSIALIKASEVPYEFRTTIAPRLILPSDIAPMGESIRGAQRWFLQVFRGGVPILNPSFKDTAPYTDAEMKAMKKEAEKYVEKVVVR